MAIERIGIIANVAKEKAQHYTLYLQDWLEQRGIEVFLEKGIAEKVGKNNGMEAETLVASVDLLIVIGGDGTILRAARFAVGYSTPMVGINLGGLGYLTEINLNEMESAMKMILKGNYKTDKRMMLDAIINQDEEAGKAHTVLNDVVINRGNLSRIVELETYVNNRYMITYKSDGLIISSPTGSTAYSLSAVGPIVIPNQKAIIINPICPHTLTNRPIILSADSCIKVILRTKERGATLTLDGQVSFKLRSGDAITVKKSQYVTTLVSSPHRDYFDILRTKLGWGGLAKNQTDAS
jgi:NAD+ kinase